MREAQNPWAVWIEEGLGWRSFTRVPGRESVHPPRKVLVNPERG